MKSSENTYESERQKKRQNNLNSLEIAFKEEGGLSESSVVENDNIGRQSNSTYGNNSSNKNIGQSERMPLTNDNVFGPDEDYDIHPLVRQPNNNQGPRYSSQSTRHSSSLQRPQTKVVYGPLNPPPDRWDYSYRRYYLVCFILFLAILGFILAIVTARPLSSVATAPTSAPTKSLEVWEEIFKGAADVINDSMVSHPHILSGTCKIKEYCGGDTELEELPIRDRVLHYLVFQDDTFTRWALREDYDNVERVIERYIVTLFAFETGMMVTENDVRRTVWKESTNWLNGQSMCNWYGLTCEDRNAFVNSKDLVEHLKFETSSQAEARMNGATDIIPMVTSISLNQNNLKGNLIPELNFLRHLERIELYQANLIGTLDKNIRNLKKLKRYWLHETLNLTGTIPPEIDMLTNLESLFIGRNSLSGSLPDFGKLPKLKTLAVHENLLEGPIPSFPSNIERLFLDSNRFNETIPEAIALLTKLRDFRVNNNELTGEIPIQLGSLRNLELFYISNNELGGSLTSDHFWAWTKLKYFAAENNNISGNIPDAFEQMKDLEWLILRNNNMSGQIPSFFANLKLTKLDLSENNFSGDFPDVIIGEDLKILKVAGNDLLRGQILDCNTLDFVSANCGVDGSFLCGCCSCCNITCNLDVN
jgi:Leucine-rich repeat (LRR) protein